MKKTDETQKDIIDFSPLTDYHKYSTLLDWNNSNTSSGILLAVIGGSTLVVTSLVNPNFFSITLLLSVLTAVCVWLYRRSNRFDGKRAAMMRSFIKTNNLTRQKVDPEKLPGTLFTIGNSQYSSDEIAGEIYSYPFIFFNYSYVVGSGKNSKTYYATVMEIKLAHTFPHMIIDSLVESGSSITKRSTLPVKFNDSQRIQLEGDFSEYFAVYAPESFGRDALTILTPDVMEMLLKSATLCDIELIDDRLYFYWPEEPESRADYETKFITTQAVLEEMDSTLSRGSIKLARAEPLTVTEAPGQRLKGKRMTYSPLLTVFVLYMLFEVIRMILIAFGLFQLSYDQSHRLGSIAANLFIAAELFLFFRILTDRKRRKDSLIRKWGRPRG